MEGTTAAALVDHAISAPLGRITTWATLALNAAVWFRLGLLIALLLCGAILATNGRSFT